MPSPAEHKEEDKDLDNRGAKAYLQISCARRTAIQPRSEKWVSVTCLQQACASSRRAISYTNAR